MKHTIEQPATAEWNEDEAILRARQGDAAAFERLYRAHCKHVYALSLRMLKNAAEAEDLTQQVFLQLFRKIGTFRGDSSFSTWLHRISVNAVLMHLRGKRPPDGQIGSFDDTGAGCVDSGQIADAGTGASAVIDSLSLKGAIRLLPPGYKRFFLLHDVMGYHHSEIAKQLGCSIGCSKSQLHKARKSLRRLLQGEQIDKASAKERPESRGNAHLLKQAATKSSTEYLYAGPNCLTSI